VLKGKFLLPSLIDTYIHLATDPYGVDTRTHLLDALRQILYSGITTVRDMAADAHTLAGLSDVLFHVSPSFSPHADNVYPINIFWCILIHILKLMGFPIRKHTV
jgi:predicted amidohydrolase YtcJ